MMYWEKHTFYLLIVTTIQNNSSGKQISSGLVPLTLTTGVIGKNIDSDGTEVN